MREEHLETLQIRLEQYYSQQSFSLETIAIDTALDVQELYLPLVDSLERLRPFGIGNPKPRFLLEKVELQEIHLMGRDKNHARLTFLSNGKSFSTVWFFAADIAAFGQVFKRYDLVVELGENVWQGKRKLEIFGVDLRLTER